MNEVKLMKNPKNRKKILLLVLTIILGLGISLAAVYFIFYQKDSRTNRLSSGLITIDFEESETVFLSSNVPVLDEVGLETTPYEFTVTNTSKVPVNLNIKINKKNATNIPLSAVRYGLYIDNELVSKDYIHEEDNSNVITIYTHENLAANATLNCKIYFWVDYYYDVPGKVFEGSIVVEAESGDVIIQSNKIIGEISKSNEPILDTNIKFYEISSATNGQGLYLRSGTENDTYPIYYYRGNIDNNNVYFAESCWKIVRTTSTGGTKLIYNGAATDVDGEKQCLETTGTGTQLSVGTKAFNSSYESPAYVGYSLPATSSRYAYSTQSLSSTIYYGSSVDQATYKLVDPVLELNDTHHYSYNSSDIDATGIAGDTGNVRYYYYKDSAGTTGYFVKFDKTKDISTILDEMLTANNSKDNPSVIQGVINDWWGTGGENSLHSKYGEYLEDTEWCNDRSIASLGGWATDGTLYSSSLEDYYLIFNERVRYDQIIFESNANNIKNTNTPILTCSNPNDRLSVANGNLTYPIGLLTFDEVAMAGARWYHENSNFYLYTNQYYWLLSPSSFSHIDAHEGFVYTNGGLSYSTVFLNTVGVRPALSLKLGTQILRGDGSKTKPYIITE